MGINIYIQFLILSLSYQTLISVVEINRHGARGAENFPDSSLQQLYGIEMKLSANGYRQHQILGNYMRERYISTNFISSSYKPNEFEIISTPTQRTIFSASGFISGLYPGHIVNPIQHDKMYPFISNDTIPVIDPLPYLKEVPLNVMSWEENRIFNSWECKYEGYVIKDISKNKTVFPDLLEVTEDELLFSSNYLAEYFNLTEELKKMTPEEFMKQVNKYIITYCYHYGISLDSFPKEVVKTVRKMYVNKWYSPRLKDSKIVKIGGSEFYEKLLTIFNAAINSKVRNFLKLKQYTKYTVYSAHDSTIVNILVNLLSEKVLQSLIEESVAKKDVYDILVPPFASNILFELHYDALSQKYYVVIIYNGKVISNYQLRGEDSNSDEEEGKIEFSKFKEFVKKRVDYDYKKLDCSNTANEVLSSFPNENYFSKKSEFGKKDNEVFLSAILNLFSKKE